MKQERIFWKVPVIHTDEKIKIDLICDRTFIFFIKIFLCMSTQDITRQVNKIAMVFTTNILFKSMYVSSCMYHLLSDEFEFSSFFFFIVEKAENVENCCTLVFATSNPKISQPVFFHFF